MARLTPVLHERKECKMPMARDGSEEAGEGLSKNGH